MDSRGRMRRGLLPLKAWGGNAGMIWRVLVSTGLIAIPETIDAFRGIGEV
jgi:hypothetical protein